MTKRVKNTKTCECGTPYQSGNKARHLTSAFHTRWEENREIVQNNTNNHVGQQTYYNDNNYVEYPNYYNNVSYDYNDPYDFVFYGNEDPEHVPDDQYDIPDGIYDISEMLSDQERARYIGKLRTRDEKYGQKFYNNPQPKLNRYEFISTSEVKKTKFVRDVYNVNSNTSGHNVLEYFQDIYPTCENISGNYMSRFRVIKFAISLMVEYIHTVEGRAVYIGHRSCNTVMKLMNQFHDLYTYIYNDIETLIHEHEGCGSGHKFIKIMSSELIIYRHKSFGGGTYVKTPCRVNYVLNINNTTIPDVWWHDKCFLLHVDAGLEPVQDHPERASNYVKCKYKYNITGLEFPITIPDGIRKFEKLNPKTAINVFEYIPIKDAVKRGLRKDFDIGIAYSTNNYRTTARVVDLLWIEEKHFALITNFNAFASSQYRLNIKHSGGDTGNVDEIERKNNYPDDKKRKELIKFGVYGKEKQVNVCRKCLMPKCTLNAYIEHIKLCIGNEPCIPKMPKDNFPKEYLDAIRIALQNENNKRSLCTGVHPRNSVMIYKRINVSNKERESAYDGNDTPNIHYIDPNTYISLTNNKPGYEVIDNVEDNDHVRLVLDVDCDRSSLTIFHQLIRGEVPTFHQ